MTQEPVCRTACSPRKTRYRKTGNRKMNLPRNHSVKTSIAIICLFLFSVASAAEPLRETSDVFPPGFNGIARYRIPGIVVTQKGTVLAYCEARRNNSSDWGEIEIHLRRSIDGGRTWEPAKRIAHMGDRLEGNPRKKEGGEQEQTVNNPVAIVDRETGAIEFLYCINYARCYSMRSTDDGLTWSDPVDITATFSPSRSTTTGRSSPPAPGTGFSSPAVASWYQSGWLMATRVIIRPPLPRRSSATTTA